MPSRIAVIGEVLVDRFEDGREIIGGAPMNVAWNLCGFGLDPLFISAVGDDATGEKILAAMNDFGMSTRGIQRSQSHDTGVVDITLDDGEPTYDIRRDVAYDFVESSSALAAIGDHFAQATDDHDRSVLYHGSLAYRASTTRQAIDDLKRQTDADVFFDINVRDGHFETSWLEPLMRGVTILKCNWDEGGMLLDMPLDEADGETLQKLSQRFADQGLRVCYLTAGSSGAHVVREDGHHASVETPRIDDEAFQDAVGAGDAFAATTIAAHMLGVAPEQALVLAVEHAAKVCTLRGATTTDRDFYAETAEAIRRLAGHSGA